MEELSPAQKKQLEAWASQRDNILSEISNLNSEIEEKKKINKNLSDSNTDIETRINQSIGRLKEIENKEKERINLVSREILDLESQKSELENKIPSLKNTITSLSIERDTLMSVIENLTSVHDKVFDRTGALESIVENVERISSENLASIEKTFEILKESSKEIIEINKKNVSETMIVIEKLPRAILEYRRPIPPVKTIMSKRGAIENARP